MICYVFTMFLVHLSKRSFCNVGWYDDTNGGGGSRRRVLGISLPCPPRFSWPLRSEGKKGKEVLPRIATRVWFTQFGHDLAVNSFYQLDTFARIIMIINSSLFSMDSPLSFWDKDKFCWNCFCYNPISIHEISH